MELKELLAIQPKGYLKDGLLGPTGEIRERVNGYYSLAMAYRCREEGLTPEVLKRVVTRLEDVAKGHEKELEDKSNPSLDQATSASLRSVQVMPEVKTSATLTAIFQAAMPHLTEWKSYAAFALHIDRIMAQLALIAATMAIGETA